MPAPAPLKTALAPHEGRLLQPAEVAVVAAGNAWLRSVQCADCGLKVFPVNDVCPSCLSTHLNELLLGEVGKLYSYTTVHVAPPGWETPYVIGYVDMPEGVRLFGKVQAANVDDLRVDMAVTVKVVAADDRYRYYFAPRP